MLLLFLTVDVDERLLLCPAVMVRVEFVDAQDVWSRGLCPARKNIPREARVGRVASGSCTLYRYIDHPTPALEEGCGPKGTTVSGSSVDTLRMIRLAVESVERSFWYLNCHCH